MDMSKWAKLEYHEFATEIYPAMNEAEFEELCSEMDENGYDKKQPIIICDGKILDGVHRHRAAIKTGKVPTFDEYKGNDPLTLVKSRNALRRHMNPSQRAMAAAAFCTFRNGGPRKGDQFANLQTDPTQENSARDHNVSPRSVADANKVLAHGTDAVVDAVRNGTLAVSDAAKIVDEPANLQNAALRDVVKGEATTATSAVRKRTAVLCARCTRIGTATKGCEGCKEARAAAKKAKDSPPASDADETVMIDAEGKHVPDQAREAFLRADDLTKICRELDDIRKRVEAIASGPGGRLLRFEDIKQKLLYTKGNIWANRATHVCGYCHGKDKKCVACKGEGWTNKMNWTATPGNDPKAKQK